MKIPIDIRVRSERILSDLSGKSNNEHPETDDFRAVGTMKSTKSGLRVEFNEENSDVTTVIDVFNGDTVSVSRIGPLNSHMIFAHGKSHTCICNTGFFPLQMRVRTKNLTNSLSLQGGRLDIEYSVEVAGNLAERNKLSFSVAPHSSIIKS